MMRELLHNAVDGDPISALRRREDTIRYIVARWNEAHEQPIDRSELGLFLCDERYGDLTEEQRSFARECKAEMREVYAEALFGLLRYLRMQSRGMVSDFADYKRIFMTEPMAGGKAAQIEGKEKAG